MVLLFSKNKWIFITFAIQKPASPSALSWVVKGQRQGLSFLYLPFIRELFFKYSLIFYLTITCCKQLTTDFRNIIGRCLIDVVIQPIGIQQITMGAPTNKWILCIVIVGKIISGNCSIQACIFITNILVI